LTASMHQQATKYHKKSMATVKLTRAICVDLN